MNFNEKTLIFDGEYLELKHLILEAYTTGEIAVVLFDPDTYEEKWGQFPNLVAVKKNGDLLWTAELPTNTSGDRYYRIASQIPLVVYSIFSEECEIDLAAGKIKTRKFFK